jgi:hypothetical protein
MAEGLLCGILGGEEEKLEAGAPEALANAEAFAAAVVARLPWCLQMVNLRSMSGNGGPIE